jgi:hypothetical protein
MKRTTTYITTIPMKNVEQVIEVKKTLQDIFGWVVLRGRHSDRKKVLGREWRRNKQNDIPWRKAETIDIYLHPKNPNYKNANSGKGIKRMNVAAPNTLLCRIYGSLNMGYYDGYMESLKTKGNTNPKFKRLYMKEKYSNKNQKLQKGDWGYIAQSILDFVEQKSEATFTEMKTYYDVVLRGYPKMIEGGSFIHHLQQLRNTKNVSGRRCNRLLYKSVNGKYKVTTQK